MVALLEEGDTDGHHRGAWGDMAHLQVVEEDMAHLQEVEEDMAHLQVV